MSWTDVELLRRYSAEKAEDAFAEIVRRHLNLVFSAALRQTGSRGLAEEAAQSVFTDLARQAPKLERGTILSAWLYQVTRRTSIDLVRRESRRQRREELAMDLSAMNTPNADWSQIEPILDEGMESLDERDRAALLLRYFENKSLREVGESLGTSEEGARKRVSRSVEKLRAFFVRRGVAAGASALGTALAANAVHSAPAGLGASIVSAAVAAGAAGPVLTASSVIAMTTLQKTVIAVAIVAAAGTGIFQSYNVSRLKSELATVRARQVPLAEEVQKIAMERDRSREALVAAENRLKELKAGEEAREVLRLRGKVGTMQTQLKASEEREKEPPISKMLNDPAMKEFMKRGMAEKFKMMYGPFLEELNLDSEGAQKFLEIMVDAASNSLNALSGKAGAGTDQELGARLRDVLGEQGAARFHEFSQEIPARTTVTMLQDRLSGQELSPEQSARMLALIKAEPNELTQGIIGSPDIAFSKSQGEITQFLGRVEESNARVLNQARSILNAEQVGALEKVLAAGVEARKVQGAAFFRSPQ